MNSILVLGSSNTDLVVRVATIPRPGETLLGHSFATYFGGKGANQAVAAARASGAVAFAGCLGNDAFGRQTRDHLKAEGLDLAYLFEAENQASGVALIQVADNGENAIAVAAGANGAFSETHLAAVDFSRFAYALFQLETPLEIVGGALRRAKAAGCRTILTPAPAARLPSGMLADVDILVPNQHEAGLLLDGPPPEGPDAAAGNLLARGAGAVVITLGEDGVALFEEKKPSVRLPAPRVRAVDTVGAGDCFTGALAVRLAEGASLEEAARFAIAAAALSFQSQGAQASYPRRPAIESFLAAPRGD